MSGKKKYPEVSKALREREEHSKNVLRKAIRESSREARSRAWDEKRAYGWHTRHLLLTYALIRGLPYSVCERSPAEEPSLRKISDLASEYGAPRSVDEVSAWLAASGEVSAPPATTNPTPLPPDVVKNPSGLLAKLKLFFAGA